MTLRRLPPVAPRVSPAELGRAFVQAFAGKGNVVARAHQSLSGHFDAPAAVMTDSGTAALVLALRLAASRTGVVAFPGYACVDLAAAARFAGVRVRLYDIDPETLSPDLESVERAVGRGVDALVVAHLFGYPADVTGVRRIAAQHGVALIEDAAQAAAGTLAAKSLGTLGDLVVLSFGRGKGLSVGGGGALLGMTSGWSDRVAQLTLAEGPSRGLSQLAKSAAQWALGRPSLYSIPAAIPWLRLGEMVYHAAEEPRPLSVAGCALLPNVLALESHAVSERRHVATELERAIRESSDLTPIAAVATGESGYLRLAVRDVLARYEPDARLGIVRPYPRTLAEQPELKPALLGGEPATPGAAEARRTVMTLPTHRFLTRKDVASIIAWSRRRSTPEREPLADSPASHAVAHTDAVERSH
ncbi:MAG TPA: DegT/DnrJ/EryC1/StrS family aminotransferase [Gemmatimonadaceae bacterium]|nr:DegT/DnrJ/EryC1/StrS family aminotransferase [Gemmatimonadaceae bacterium]